jgi:hypothetical protein
MFCLGLDIGSLSCDAVLIDADGDGDVVSWSVVPTGARNSAAIERARRDDRVRDQHRMMLATPAEIEDEKSPATSGQTDIGDRQACILHLPGNVKRCP